MKEEWNRRQVVWCTEACGLRSPRNKTQELNEQLKQNSCAKKHSVVLLVSDMLPHLKMFIPVLSGYWKLELKRELETEVELSHLCTLDESLRFRGRNCGIVCCGKF